MATRHAGLQWRLTSTVCRHIIMSDVRVKHTYDIHGDSLGLLAIVGNAIRLQSSSSHLLIVCLASILGTRNREVLLKGELHILLYNQMILRSKFFLEGQLGYDL